MEPITKSFYDILMYWKDYRITENGNVVPRETDEGELVVWDWAEPCCWACNKQIIVDEEKRTDMNGQLDPVKVWKEVGGRLERCHIIPKSLGGTSDVNNAFILCPECHAESPDTKNASSFIRWVYRKRKNSFLGMGNFFAVEKELDEELKQRGLPKSREIFEMLNEQIKIEKLQDELHDYCMQNCGAHYGVGTSHSSIIAVMCDWIEEKYRNACHHSYVVV